MFNLTENQIATLENCITRQLDDALTSTTHENKHAVAALETLELVEVDSEGQFEPTADGFCALQVLKGVYTFEEIFQHRMEG